MQLRALSQSLKCCHTILFLLIKCYYYVYNWYHPNGNKIHMYSYLTVIEYFIHLIGLTILLQINCPNCIFIKLRTVPCNETATHRIIFIDLPLKTSMKQYTLRSSRFLLMQTSCFAKNYTGFFLIQNFQANWQ